MRKHRLIFDVSGLLHWYAYHRTPSGIQRFMERILGAAPLQHEGAVFVWRPPASETFFILPSCVIVDLSTSKREQAIADLRRFFAASLSMSTWSGLLSQGLYYHMPAALLARARRSVALKKFVGKPSVEVDDILVILGDFWCFRDQAERLEKLADTLASRLVVMIHDLVPITHPHWAHPSYQKEFVRQMSRLRGRTDQWLVNSEHTRSELVHYLSKETCRSDEIALVNMGSFLADGSAGQISDAGIVRFGLSAGCYLLHVGTIEPRKNLGLLLDAFEALKRHGGHPALKLVLVGKYGWSSKRVKRKLRSSWANKYGVTWLGALDDESLHLLYRHARALVIPSLQEGWGLPIQEAISLGTPCLISGTGGMTGLNDPLATRIRIDSVEAMAQDMSDFLSSQPRSYPDARTRVPYTWTEAANDLIQTIFKTRQDFWGTDKADESAERTSRS